LDNKNSFSIHFFWLLFVFNSLEIFLFIYNKYRVLFVGVGYMHRHLIWVYVFENTSFFLYVLVVTDTLSVIFLMFSTT